MARMLEVLCIIPARGGSKGIPQKNVRLVAGRPLLAYSIEHAKQTPAIRRVVVSTDDPEIAAVAKQWDAEVVWRPAEISGDMASSESALLDVLDQLREAESYEPDLVVFLQPTSPLRRPKDIQNAIQTLLDQDGDSLFSARPVEGFVWRLSSGAVQPVNYDPTRRPCRQDLPDRYLEENGSVYIFKPQVLRTYHSRLGGRIVACLMHPLDSLQVDEPQDLATMESLLALRLRPETKPDLANVRLLILDFDGVMTDNRVRVDQDGKEAVWCHRGDGLGIARLKAGGVETLVLSTERNAVVNARCEKLGIACIQACDDKLGTLEDLMQQRTVSPHQVAYVGNDVNDLECLERVGFPIAVADAVPQIKATARWITSRPGGSGAVREVADWILAALQSQETVIQKP